MAPLLTHELLARAEAKLKDAESALRADPANKWLGMAVQVARDKVESIQRSLLDDGGKPGAKPGPKRELRKTNSPPSRRLSKSLYDVTGQWSPGVTTVWLGLPPHRPAPTDHVNSLRQRRDCGIGFSDTKGVGAINLCFGLGP
jgi:hypothetical protein